MLNLESADAVVGWLAEERKMADQMVWRAFYLSCCRVRSCAWKKVLIFLVRWDRGTVNVKAWSQWLGQRFLGQILWNEISSNKKHKNIKVSRCYQAARFSRLLSCQLSSRGIQKSADVQVLIQYLKFLEQLLVCSGFSRLHLTLLLESFTATTSRSTVYTEGLTKQW